jgi:hypothetical protein
MKVNSPQVGFNNNIRHNGRVFHVQTEDSGVARPHIITHLFADGGRILKTTKTSYAEILDADDLAKQVRRRMQEQHKAMLIALRAGDFDEKPRPDGPASLPPNATLPPSAQPSGNLVPTAPLEPQPTQASVAAEPPAVGGGQASKEHLAAGPSEPLESPPTTKQVDQAAIPRAPSVSAPPVPLELDFGDLDTAARAAPSPSPEPPVAPEPIPSLPPPPDRARRAPPGSETVYRSVMPREAEYLVEMRPARASQPRASASSPPRTAAPPPSRPSGSTPASKYAAPRTARALEPNRARDEGARAAAGVVEEPSLDDVIRSYLSEDDPPPRSGP